MPNARAEMDLPHVQIAQPTIPGNIATPLRPAAAVDAPFGDDVDSDSDDDIVTDY